MSEEIFDDGLRYGLHLALEESSLQPPVLAHHEAVAGDALQSFEVESAGEKKGGRVDSGRTCAGNLKWLERRAS